MARAARALRAEPALDAGLAYDVARFVHDDAPRALVRDAWGTLGDGAEPPPAGPYELLRSPPAWVLALGAGLLASHARATAVHVNYAGLTEGARRRPVVVVEAERTHVYHAGGGVVAPMPVALEGGAAGAGCGALLALLLGLETYETGAVVMAG